MLSKLLEADSVRIAFQGRSILSDISIRCRSGSVVGLLGRNGCGKSTLLQIIFGSLEVEDAIIRIDGVPAKPIYKAPWYCSLLPQQPFLPWNISIGKACKLFSIDFKDAASEIPQLQNESEKLVAELSYGSIRLLEIYLVIKKKGDFCLLDEPFNGLSPIAREQVQSWIRETLPQKGFLISDHDYRSVMDICDELYLLRDGKNWLCKNEEDLIKGGYLPG